MFLKDPRKKYNFAFIGSGIQEALGAGKTIFLADIAYRLWNTYNVVYSNFKLNEDIIENAYYLDEITPDVIMNLRPNSLLLLHESYNYFDRRYCTKGINKKIMYSCFQLRKKNTHLVGDVPKLQYLEMRVTDIGTQYWNGYGNPYYRHPIYDSYFVYSELNIIPSYMTGRCYFTEKGKYVIDLKHCYDCYNHKEQLKIKETENNKSKNNTQNLNMW